ncbi:ADYC domain-containing protein [Microvirga roseola]|uniref:ADYC domain-containing protein n=1 Tax=Microvirga roseola TaxID=2883126 RepID=UPI001E40031B|nr:ADYC domain-containing protein [Microvirga roseola]
MHPQLLSIAGVLLPLVWSMPVQALDGRLEAERGEFRLRLDDGRVLERQDLAGMRVLLRSGAREIQVLIDAVEEEKASPGGPLVLYRLLIEDPNTGSSQDACLPDARGRRLGLPLRKGSGIDFTCTSGAEAKCILIGYRPWEEGGDIPMRDLHAACIHMVRADHGGDDRPSTRDGTVIDVYDRFGIQKPETLDPMPFEAAWGVNGALCVAHPRIAQNTTLAMLEKRYPRLAGRLGPEACIEDEMRDDPRALLFNRSVLSVP